MAKDLMGTGVLSPVMYTGLLSQTSIDHANIRNYAQDVRRNACRSVGGANDPPYTKHLGHGLFTGRNRRNGPDFGRVFLMLNYTDITQNTYIQS